MEPLYYGLIAGAITAIGLTFRKLLDCFIAIIEALKHRGNRKAAIYVFDQTRSTEPLMAVIEPKSVEKPHPIGPKAKRGKQSQAPRLLSG